VRSGGPETSQHPAVARHEQTDDRDPEQGHGARRDDEVAGRQRDGGERGDDRE
jgi:hypothetical protein